MEEADVVEKAYEYGDITGIPALDEFLIPVVGGAAVGIIILGILFIFNERKMNREIREGRDFMDS